MTQKKDNHPKIELLFREREESLEQIKEIDNLLLSKERGDLEAILALTKRIEASYSFAKLANWLHEQIEFDPETSRTRLDAVLQLLENEFPALKPPDVQKDNKIQGFSDSTETVRDKPDNMVRYHIIFITITLLDKALILHIFNHNNAAIIELYGALERYAVNTLSKVLIIPERQTIGLKLIERRTLPDLASLLKDCGVFEKKHVKFCNRLSRLRNGLAHRNTGVVSKVILSGKEINEFELETAVSDEVFYEYLIGTVWACGNLMQSEEEDIKSEQFPLGFLNENK